MKTYMTPELCENTLVVEGGFASSRWIDGENSSYDFSITSDVDNEFE